MSLPYTANFDRQLRLWRCKQRGLKDTHNITPQNKTLNPLPLEDATHFQVVESHLIRAETPETGCSYLKNDEYLQDKNGDNFRGEDAHCVVCDSECAYKMMP